MLRRSKSQNPFYPGRPAYKFELVQNLILSHKGLKANGLKANVGRKGRPGAARAQPWWLKGNSSFGNMSTRTEIAAESMEMATDHE